VSAIQKELKQVRPFTARSVEGVVALLRTTDLLRRVLSGVVESRHLTLQQFNVLRILRGAGPDGMPTLEIGERMIEQSPGITRLMDRLESKALVKRERCPRDRRQVLCRITPPGLAVLAALEAPMEQAARSFLGCLGETKTRGLIHLLDAVRAAQGAPEDLPSPPRKPPPSIRTGKPVPHFKQGEKR
jgi:MarR family transcriptional regulator, organic hydroperoxide resistance regulator